MATIVSAAMGYEPEDLPWEVPLIELGLDSLMAVRIKNRVEYDFDLPPIQLQAVRDANLYAVEKLIQYAIEHRDEVEQLHEYQQTKTPEEIAKEQAALLSASRPRGAPRRKHRPNRKLRHQTRRFRRRRPTPRVPTRRRPRRGGRPGAQPAGCRRCAGLRCAAA